MRRSLTCALLGVLVTTTPAAAASFTLSPATAGLTWSIENQGLAPADLIGGDDDTYAILLTLDANGFVGSGQYLAGFAVDFSGTNFDGLAMVTAPSSYGFTLSSNVSLAGASANCSGASAGSACVADASTADNNVLLTTNGTHTWLFHVDIGVGGFSDSTTLAFAVTTIHQGRFKGGATVITGTTGSLGLPDDPPTTTDPAAPAPVPEPASLMLLGTGLVLAARRMRRRQ